MGVERLLGVEVLLGVERMLGVEVLLGGQKASVVLIPQGWPALQRLVKETPLLQQRLDSELRRSAGQCAGRWLQSQAVAAANEGAEERREGRRGEGSQPVRVTVRVTVALAQQQEQQVGFPAAVVPVRAPQTRQWAREVWRSAHWDLGEEKATERSACWPRNPFVDSFTSLHFRPCAVLGEIGKCIAWHLHCSCRALPEICEQE